MSQGNSIEIYSGKDIRAAAYRKVVDAIATDVRAQLDR